MPMAEYLSRLRNGERAIWTPEIKFLNCFSNRFSGDHERVIYTTWNGMFELASEFDSEGSWIKEDPIGIQFLCADAQLHNSTTLLTKRRPDGSLSCMDIVKDAISHLKKRGPMPQSRRNDCALAYKFLRENPITVPKAEIDKILATFKYH